MADRPILFNDAMVLAILSGSKTQTRRLVKLPHQNPLGVWQPHTIGGPNGGRTAHGETIPEQGAIWHTRTGKSVGCPYGQPGDRLWVREAWTVNLTGDAKRGGPGTVPIYRAEHPNAASRWRPSIHMPRWASRITLDVTGVRVERLQQIDEADAKAEGVTPADEPHPMKWEHYVPHGVAFRRLWEGINGPGSWEANPWVWVVEFKRVPS